MSPLFFIYNSKMPRGNSFEKLGPAVVAVHRLVRVVCATSARSFPPPSFVAGEGGVAVSDALWLDHDLLWLVYEGVGEGEV